VRNHILAEQGGCPVDLYVDEAQLVLGESRSGYVEG
jgi:hypothetical protein